MLPGSVKSAEIVHFEKDLAPKEAAGNPNKQGDLENFSFLRVFF
jgi:hypothetical protein